MAPALRHVLLLLVAPAVALRVGPVISPSRNAARWDAACVANPVVLPPRNADEDWRCFYYGNAGGYGESGGWNGGVKCFLPTGYCGLATSPDGVSWNAVDGANADGSVFAPGELSAWDGLHVGVGDIVRLVSAGDRTRERPATDTGAWHVLMLIAYHVRTSARADQWNDGDAVPWWV
jgi:hypothetical protein